MPDALRLDHVAVAVRDIKPALKLFREGLGGEYLMGREHPGGWRWVQVRYEGGGKVELLEPMGEGFLSRFLDARGEGLHHVTFKTGDIRSVIARLEALGYELVDVNLEREEWKEAFLRPSGAHGVLIQVAQSALPDDVVARHIRPSNLDDLLS
jgi:methylmalonyl-CoA/ethylmalonyl-CoA epimerase